MVETDCLSKNLTATLMQLELPGKGGVKSHASCQTHVKGSYALGTLMSGFTCGLMKMMPHGTFGRELDDPFSGMASHCLTNSSRE